MKFKGIVIGFMLFSQVGYSINYPAKKGDGHIGIGYKTTSYSSVFDQDGERKSSPKTISSQWILSGNYGLSNKFNVSVYAPVYIQNKVQSNADFNLGKDLKSSGPSDMEIGLSYSFAEQKKLIATATLKQSLGFGKNDQAEGLNTGYGDNATSIHFDLYYQLNTHLYFGGSTGVRKRNKGFSDDFSGEFLAGWHILPCLDLTGNINGLFPFENGDEEVNGGYYGLYRNNAGYMAVNTTLSYNYNRTAGISVEVNNYLKGQLIGAEPIFGVKIFYLITGKEKVEDKQTVPETTPEKK